VDLLCEGHWLPHFFLSFIKFIFQFIENIALLILQIIFSIRRMIGESFSNEKVFLHLGTQLRMRKALSILLIVVFFIAQYGNVLSYAYCKWQAETMSASCDCEKKFTEGTKDSDHPAPVALKDKSEDPYIKADVVIISKFSKQVNSCFVNKISFLSKGFKSSPLRPPSII